MTKIGEGDKFDRLAASTTANQVTSLQNYTVRLVRSEGWWAASIDEWPGVLTQGKTVASTLVNLADAVRISVADELHERDGEGVRG